jgi:NADH dehydrogenase/NADH:ubiquinone oxidoreductase subunit G
MSEIKFNSSLFNNIEKDQMSDQKEFLQVAIDDSIYLFEDDLNIIQACLEKDIYIPRFCYHASLKIVGNCRLCFVENANSSKPIISCAVPIENEMVLYTNTDLVVKARRYVIEFLLINHPLDCPICDQGGECDLQDQFIVFGGEEGFFYEKTKRSVEDKFLSPLIKLSLNRCIHRARCTRFAHDIVGVYDSSLLGRGLNTEIGSYIKAIFNSELSGNIIDLCPVGALTSTAYSFKARLLELFDIRYIDVFDSVNTYLRIDFRGTKLIRVIPVSNVFLDDEWITDVTRFNYDSFVTQRLTYPLVLMDTKFFNISWNQINFYIRKNFLKLMTFFILKKKLFINNFFLSEIFIDLLKELFVSGLSENFKIDRLNNTNKNKLIVDFRKKYLLDFDNLMDNDNFLLINTNLRLELPLINVKMREKANLEYITIFLLGFVSNLNYFFLHLGNSLLFILVFLEKYFYMYNISSLNIIVGSGLYYFSNFFALLINALYFYINQIKFLKVNYFNLFCIKNLSIYTHELNFHPVFAPPIQNINDIYKLNYSINDDNINYSLISLLKKKLTIYHGQHADYFIDYATIVLPSKLFLDQPSKYLNIMGLANSFVHLMFNLQLQEIKNDDEISTNLFSTIFNKDNYPKINFKKKHVKQVVFGVDSNFRLMYFTGVETFNNKLYVSVYNWVIEKINKFTFLNLPTLSVVNRFYLQDPLSRNSPLMFVNNMLLSSHDFTNVEFSKWNKWVF